MRRMPMCRISSFFVWIGIAGLMGCLGCAPWLPTQSAASAPSEISSETTWFAAPFPERFHDASGRLRALPGIEEPVSIQLDAKSDLEWPSFLDPAALGAVPDAAPEGTVVPGPGAMLTARLFPPSLDSPGRWW